jgi:LysR family transcriptional regulator for metE and metH
MADLGHRGERFDIEIMDNSLAYPLIKAVIDGKVDIAISGGEIDDRRVRRHHLFDDELVGVLPVSHALATRRHLEAADFARETYLSYSTIPEKGFEDERFFRPARAMPKRWRRAGDVAMILEMVRQGLGVSILSRWAVAPSLAAGGLVMKRLTAKGLPTTWQAVIRGNEPKESGSSQIATHLAEWWSSDKRGKGAVV